ncbi:MAG TPA: FAD-dependent oxidoreductase, partial [Candidatus Hydrogenedentes bacterium]|nr:FAD-dependent oxidoreductase [Candidatus Hydrogenedentota bacterium]
MSHTRRHFLKGTLAAASIGGVAMEQASGDTGAGVPDTSAAVSFQRTIPVRHDVDVFIAGGGPAGVAAAVAAARQGAKVFLIERHNCLGGMGTVGLVPVFMQFSDGEHFLAAGLGQEIRDQLTQAGGNAGGNPNSIRAEVLKRVYDDLMLDAGVSFTFETRLIGVETQGDAVTLAVLAAKSGLFAVRAKVFIDCTGDGDLATWAGAPFEQGDENGEVMAGTLCSLWADIDWERAASGQRGKEEKLVKAIEDGVFTKPDRHLPGIWRVGNELGGGNIGHTFGVDGTDERSVTEALIWGRKLVLEYERFYKEYLEGFEHMELAALGPALGLRETRRIMGDYVLNLNDFKERATFDDEIGRYSYPVDIHASKSGDAAYEKFLKDYKAFRYGKGENYGIPY